EAALRIMRTFMDHIATEQPALMESGARQMVDQDLPEAISLIQSSAMRVDRLIRAVNHLSRESVRSLAAQAIDLAALADKLGAAFAPRFEQQDVEFVVKRPWPKLVSDPAAVEQILHHLLDNAVTYLSENRPGKIVMSGRRRARMIEISVQDNG